METGTVNLLAALALIAFVGTAGYALLTNRPTVRQGAFVLAIIYVVLALVALFIKH